jgi:hypothetical protein
MPLERLLATLALSVITVTGLSGCVTIVPAAPAPVADGSVPQEQDDDFGTVEVYTVLGDGTLDPAASGLTATVWDTFTRVATLDFAAEVMTQYRVGDSATSDTLAYVYQDDDPQYWVLAANLATSDDPTQLVATLIHEYGHILMLATDEMDPAATSCDTIELDEGCAHGDSVLLAFQQQFWAPYGEAAPDLANTDADLAWEFYLAHEDDFVSDYAATNAIEDAAETFMTFVLEDEPTGDSMVARKLEFFWAYPELVAIRERIRTEFADDLGLVG